MGRSTNRNVYFKKMIEPQPTPASYLKALEDSPYRTHRRMAVALKPLAEQLTKDLEEQQKKVALEQFAETLRI
jgi:hypothetical protein